MKKQLERMSAGDRSEVEAFLAARRIGERSGFRERVAAAQRRMDGGDAVSAAELRALLQANSPVAD